MRQKVIIILTNGGASLIEQPLGVDVELRDYDVDEDFEGEVATDEEGDQYQRVTFPARVSPAESELIMEISAKAQSLMNIPRHEILMDITSCHENCELDLKAMLADGKSGMAHDVSGIREHLDRDTGKLKNDFRPRFAKK